MLRRTKLFRPSVPQDFVIRSRLLDKLSQGLSRPLTLICAPAGYGKTSLASSFLQTCTLPWAWLSPGETDNDLRLFLDYLLTALDALFPGALHRTQLLIAGLTLPPTAVIADSLINELAALEREFVLALDDVHAIQADETLAMLTERTEGWADCLSAVSIRVEHQPNEAPVTVIAGRFQDQAALAGALSCLYNLGLPLLSVECIGFEPG